MSDANHVERVRAMMQGFGQNTPVHPMIPPTHERMRCFRLLLEEVLEYGAAAGLVAITHQGDGVELNIDEIAIVESDDIDAQLTSMVDACADISVVNVGAFLAMGIDPEPVLQMVDENNLLKIKTGKLDLVTGKFKKHPDHPKPAFATEVLRQLEQAVERSHA
jgi:predicted HAD superfamily Cof-like phosphohydrolase